MGALVGSVAARTAPPAIRGGGGRGSRQKGDRRERQVVELLRSIGCEAERVPLSGAVGGRYAGDVVLNSPSGRVAMQGEVKARASGEGWATLERWLADNDVLFLVRDRAEPLAVLPWPILAKLLGAA